MEGFREACITSSSDKFQLVQSCFVAYRKKAQRSGFCGQGVSASEDKEQRRLVNHIATEDPPEDACSKGSMEI